MIKKYVSLFLFMLFVVQIKGQINEIAINQQSASRSIEKIHIHFDKDIYLPGETIWFKAYVFDGNLPSELSTNLYISLYNTKGEVLQQKLYPILNSTSDGYFELPDTTYSTEVLCRAYTSWMLNFDTNFLFTKSLKVFIANGKVDTLNISKQVTLTFFPEGGDFIEGVNNTIAFKASFNNGLPYDFNAKIKKAGTNELVDSIRSEHNGMGKFNIFNDPTENYYAHWIDNNGKIQQTPLPTKKPTGVSLKIALQKNKLYYNVINKWLTDTLYVLGYMHKKIIFKSTLLIPKDESYTGVVPTEWLPTGIMQITVLNNTFFPLAERICFINNNNFTIPTQLNSKHLNTKKRGENLIEIDVTDSLPTNMSLAITDADFNDEDSKTNIYTNLLLSGDIKGYIHNPAYYFKKDTTDKLKNNYLDLLMLTNGWRKYNWQNIIAENPKPLNFAKDDFLSIYGQMSNYAYAKIKKDETINLIVKTKDSTTQFYSIIPNEKGLLKMAGLVFFDTAKVYFSLNAEKKLNNQINFSSSNYTLTQPKTINNFSQFLLKDTSGTSIFNTKEEVMNKYVEAYKQNQKFNVQKTLSEVVVKSGGWRNWKNNPLVKLEDAYTSGMFKGGATAFTIDVLHDNMAAASFDIYNYLSNKIPGLSISYSKMIGVGKGILFRGEGVDLFLDEHIQENSQIQNVSISDIAYIKFIEHFNGEGLRDANVLSIYLKKGNDLIDRRPKETDLGFVKIAGYSNYKEFYSPNYAETQNSKINDNRTTLLWQPYIFTNKNNNKIPITFYNSDFIKRFKIVLEGINEDGKLIHIEKIME